MGIQISDFGPTVFDVEELRKILELIPESSCPNCSLRMKLSPMDFDYSDLEKQVKEETGVDIKLNWSHGDNMDVSFLIRDPSNEEIIEWYKRDRDIFCYEYKKGKKWFHFKELTWTLPTENTSQGCWMKLTPERIGVLYGMSDKMPDYVQKIADIAPRGVYVTIKKTNSFSFNQI